MRGAEPRDHGANQPNHRENQRQINSRLDRSLHCSTTAHRARACVRAYVILQRNRAIESATSVLTVDTLRLVCSLYTLQILCNRCTFKYSLHSRDDNVKKER